MKMDEVSMILVLETTLARSFTGVSMMVLNLVSLLFKLTAACVCESDLVDLKSGICRESFLAVWFCFEI